MMHEKFAVLPQSVSTPLTQRRTCVLVLGMHRSGTSAITRVLNLLGCDLPKTLMAPAKSNDAGHWESQPAADFNDRLMESAGSSWDDWLAFNPGWFSSPKATQFHDEALSLLESEFSTSHLFVLKDPRICRLAPFWLNVLAAHGVAPRIVLPVRNPLEVAMSLAERNGLEPALGHLLWLRHTLDAEHSTRGRERFFASYDSLMRNWSSIAADAGKALGLSWPRQSARVDAEVSAFLDKKHRHHELVPDDTLRNLHLSAWLRDSFRVLMDWAQSGEKPQDFALLDRIRCELDSASPAFVQLIHSGRRAAEKASTLEMELTAKQTKLLESERIVDTAQTQLTERDARVAKLSADCEAVSQVVKATEQTLAEVRSRVLEAEMATATHANRGTKLEGALEAARKQLTEKDGRVAKLSADCEAVSQVVKATEQTLAEVRSRLLEAEMASAAHANRGAELEGALEAARKQLTERDGRVAKLSADCEATSQVAKATEQTLAEVRSKLLEAEMASAAHANRGAKLEGALEAARKQLTEKDGSLEKLSVDREAVSQVVKATEQTLAEVRSRLLEAEKASAAHANRGAELEGALEAARKQLTEKDGSLAKLSADFAAATQATKVTEQSLAELTAIFMETGKSAAAHEERSNQLKALLNVTNQRLLDQEVAIAGGKAERETLKNATTLAESGLVFTRAKLAEAEARVRHCENEIATATRESSALQLAELQQVQSRLAERIAEITALSRLMATNESEVSTLRGQLVDKNSKITQLSAERDELAGTAKLGESALAHMRDMHADAEAMIVTIRSQLAQSESDAAARLARLEADKREAESRLADRFSEIAALTGMLSERQSAVRKQEERARWMREIAMVLSGDLKREARAWLPATVLASRKHKELQKRKLFDGDAYLEANPDVANAGLDALRHYVGHGIDEGRPLSVSGRSK